MELTRNIIKRCEDDTNKSDYYSYYVNNKVGILTDHGFFCEIFSIKRLQKEWELMDSYMKEHVTPIFYTKNDMLISKLPYDNHKMKGVRLTIDTIEDYNLCREVFDILRGKKQDIDGIIDILRPCHYEIMKDKSKNNIK
jgi:spore coat polysaccharide biosynthesis protein SpsF (cytidylyltransferase family)